MFIRLSLHPKSTMIHNLFLVELSMMLNLYTGAYASLYLGTRIRLPACRNSI